MFVHPARAQAGGRKSVSLDVDHSRDAFLTEMTYHGIGVGVHYLSLTEQPYYHEHLGWTPEDTPHGTRVGRQIVSLPISAKLTDDDVGDVIEAVRRSLRVA